MKRKISTTIRIGINPENVLFSAINKKGLRFEKKQNQFLLPALRLHVTKMAG